MPARINHYEAVLRICVDELGEGGIRGRVVSRRLTEPMPFSDVGHLLLQLEEVFDHQNFPQAFERRRTFGARQEESSLPLAQTLEQGMDPVLQPGISDEYAGGLHHHPVPDVRSPVSGHPLAGEKIPVIFHTPSRSRFYQLLRPQILEKN